jgi:hypothetical protein
MFENTHLQLKVFNKWRQDLFPVLSQWSISVGWTPDTAILYPVPTGFYCRELLKVRLLVVVVLLLQLLLLQRTAHKDARRGCLGIDRCGITRKIHFHPFLVHLDIVVLGIVRDRHGRLLSRIVSRLVV